MLEPSRYIAKNRTQGAGSVYAVTSRRGKGAAIGCELADEQYAPRPAAVEVSQKFVLHALPAEIPGPFRTNNMRLGLKYSSATAATAFTSRNASADQSVLLP